MELETRFESDAWYIPSAVAFGAEGETQVQSSSVSQERSVSTRLSRSVPIVRPERLAIFPNDPLAEPEPTFLADSDRLANRTAFQYPWQADRVLSATPSTLARRLGLDGEAQLVINREQISVDSSITFADPASLGTTTILPLRITLEHSSEVTQTENLSFRLSLLGQGGIEKHVSAGYVDLVPAFGAEFRLGVTIRY